MTLEETASGIQTHLSTFEADLDINVSGNRRGKPYNGATAVSGSKISIKYRVNHATYLLSSAKASSYLVWLDDGNVGKHYEMPK